MTVWYSNELAGIDSVPAVKANASVAYNAKVLRFRATVPLTAQQIGDTINLARFPAGTGRCSPCAGHAGTDRLADAARPV